MQTPAALSVADLLHTLDLTAQSRHPLTDPATVRLDLGLAGPAGAHTAATAAGTAALAGHRLTPTAQPRQHVLHLGQFHLGLALSAAGVLGEDIQDQRGAVDDLDLHHFLQCVQLRRAELAIADHRVGTGRGDDVAQLDGLTGADIGCRIGFVAPLNDALQDFRAGGLGQGGKFGKAGVGVGGGSVHPHPHQDHTFQPQLPVFDLGDVGKFGGQPGHAPQRGTILEREFADAGVGGGGVGIKISHTNPIVSRGYNVAHPNNVAGHCCAAHQASESSPCANRTDGPRRKLVVSVTVTLTSPPGTRTPRVPVSVP